MSDLQWLRFQFQRTWYVLIWCFPLNKLNCFGEQPFASTFLVINMPLTIIKKYMAQSRPYILASNLPFGICAIYFDLKAIFSYSVFYKQNSPQSTPSIPHSSDLSKTERLAAFRKHPTTIPKNPSLAVCPGLGKEDENGLGAGKG